MMMISGCKSRCSAHHRHVLAFNFQSIRIIIYYSDTIGFVHHIIRNGASEMPFMCKNSIKLLYLLFIFTSYFNNKINIIMQTVWKTGLPACHQFLSNAIHAFVVVYNYFLQSLTDSQNFPMHKSNFQSHRNNFLSHMVWGTFFLYYAHLICRAILIW